MAAVTGTITALFNLFFAPFARLDPWVGMAAVSLVSGLVLLVIFKYTSSQRGLRRTKDRLIAHLLEVVLYRDEMGVVVRAQGRLLLDNLRYLGYTLVPLACMIVPGAVLLLQIDLHYGHRPLAVGERAIVTVQLEDAAAVETAALRAPAGVVVETPSVRQPLTGRVDWRIRGAAPGRYELQIQAGGTEVAKSVVVGHRGAPAARDRVGGGALAQLLHPGELPLPPGPVTSVRVSYPSQVLPLGRWRLFWLWPWLVLSMAFGYSLRGPLRVSV